MISKKQIKEIVSKKNKRISKKALKKIEKILKDDIKKIIRIAINNSDIRGRKTIKEQDLKNTNN